MKEWRIEMAKKSLTRRGLKIIVVGCGKVGETLTDQLTREGHEVTLIDKDPTKVHDLTNMYDVRALLEQVQVTVYRWRQALRAQTC